METKKTINTLNKNFGIILYFLYILGFLAFGKILSAQLFAREKVTSDDFSKEQIIEATRGSILACDGRPLAISIPFFEIRMDCSTIKDDIFNKNIDALSKELSKLFGDKSSSVYKKEIKAARKKGNKYKKIGNRNIDFDELERIKSFPIYKEGKFEGGLIIEQKDIRTYPYGSLAYRTIGYTNAVDGGVGIEKSYNYKLKGTPGHRHMQRQLGGNWIPVNENEEIPAIDGIDIQTTIDISIQETAEAALKEQLELKDVLEGGTAIVMETSTGAIRAIANMHKDKHGNFKESFNYAIGYASDPGSTLKLASLISLIEDGYVNLDTPVDGGDGKWVYYKKIISDTHTGGYGMLNVQKAFEKSSNVCFAKLMVNYYENHPEDYVNRLYDMKLAEKFGLEIEGEGICTIWTPNDKKIWSKLSLPQMGIGYEVLITPLHTLTFYNAIANNGKMMKPYFIENFQKNGNIIREFDSHVLSGSICSKKTVKEVKKALRGVVANGTAKKINDERYEISGKTGTAQRLLENNKYIDSNGFKKYQASFAGFFPSDNPKYTCVVVIYSGKTRGNIYGGSWAAPVFKKISDHIYATHPKWESPLTSQNLKPKDNPSIASGRSDKTKTALNYLKTNSNINIKNEGWLSCSINNNNLEITELRNDSKVVPNTMNMGLRDALYLLENEGYTVKVKGSGRVVNQIPSAGSFLNEKGLVTIELDN